MSVEEDDDWPIPPESVDIQRYQGQGNDLSGHIDRGQRLSDYRSLAGLAPKELADAAGVTLSELLAIEAGLMEISGPQAVKLSAALGLSAEDL